MADWIITFGRVPFFYYVYYVAHLYLIHALAIVLSLAMVGEASWLINRLPTHKPPGFGLALPGLYAVWLFAVVALYPASRWFADLKQRRREWWWTICRRPRSRPIVTLRQRLHSASVPTMGLQGR